LKEVGELLGLEIENNDQAVEQCGRAILNDYQIQNILITRSEKGMTLVNADGVSHIPTVAREVYDVSGAGDTVVAVLALCLGQGLTLPESIFIANQAAGIVVSKLGTVPIEIEELRASLCKNECRKILGEDTLNTVVQEHKKKGQRLVFTNGCFDILHRGHIEYLRKARYLGDNLIVGVNSDSSVKRLKGDSRPINNEADRMEILAALEFVDYVVLFDSDTPYDLIQKIQPDILVKGGDYQVQDIVGKEFAGKTMVIPFVEGYSTTKTIMKSKQGQ
jgi:D-beta-D-heptose 7-phosphate kinase/D-beta-D-heptose 1-phosphate adenosyltransferase